MVRGGELLTWFRAHDPFDDGGPAPLPAGIEKCPDGRRTPRTVTATAPDHQQLVRVGSFCDERIVEHRFVDRCVLDDAARWLLEAIGRDDEPGARSQGAGVEHRADPKLHIEQDGRGERRQDARRVDLEPGQGFVGHRFAGVRMAGEHRPQRFTLVEREHRERAAWPGKGVKAIRRAGRHDATSRGSARNASSSARSGIAPRPSSARHDSAAAAFAQRSESGSERPSTIAARNAPWNTSPAPSVLTTWDGSAGAVTTSARLPSAARFAATLPMDAARDDDQIRDLLRGPLRARRAAAAPG